MSIAKLNLSGTLSFAEYQFCEDISAVSINFGSSPKYEKAYKKAAGEQGFPVFYQAAITAAQAMRRVQKRLKVVWGDSADWVITIENFSNAILDFAIKKGYFPADFAMEELAQQSIRWW